MWILIQCCTIIRIRVYILKARTTRRVQITRYSGIVVNSDVIYNNNTSLSREYIILYYTIGTEIE